MNIECLKEKLLAGVSTADRVTGKNLTLPILNSLLLIARDKTLHIRATNLDLGLEIKVPAKVTEEGIAAISGNVLNNLLSHTHDKVVTLKVKNGNISVSAKNTATIIKSFPYEDFPTLPRIENKTPFLIDAQKFISGLKSVFYSASVSDIKPEIASVYLYSDNGNIVFVATDSFRLAEKKIPIAGDAAFSPVLIPIKNVIEIMRILEPLSETVAIHFEKNQISIVTDGLYITSRLVDGIFPDYQQIIPKEFKTEAVVLKQDLLSALKISNIFSDKFNQVGLSIDPQKKSFTIFSQNADVGENTTALDAALSGEKLALNFNFKYLFDCFASMMKDSLALQFSGEARPLVIVPVGDKTFTYLVMPLNK